MKKNTSRNKKKNKIMSKQIVAMTGVIFLILMYLVTLVLAFTDNSASGKYFALCLACTFVVPIIIWLYSWMYGRATRKRVPGDPEKEE